MAAPTAAEQLAVVDQAIYDLVTRGLASASALGNTYTYEDLDKLRRWRQTIQAEAAVKALSAAGTRRVAVGRFSKLT